MPKETRDKNYNEFSKKSYELEEIGKKRAEPDWYIRAAKYRTGAGEIKEAIRDYKEAASLLKEMSETYSKAGIPVASTQLKRDAEDCIRNAKRLSKLTLTGKLLRGKWHGLEGTMAASIIGLLGGLFFLSSNLTGNVIGNMTNSTSNWIGGVLFLVGIIGAFIYFKNK
jgi:hypothetical protein